jgi:hypothetical protein
MASGVGRGYRNGFLAPVGVPMGVAVGVPATQQQVGQQHRAAVFRTGWE